MGLTLSGGSDLSSPGCWGEWLRSEKVFIASGHHRFPTMFLEWKDG